MDEPSHSRLDYPEVPRQENRPEADDSEAPGAKCLFAVVVFVALGVAVAYVIGDL